MSCIRQSVSYMLCGCTTDDCRTWHDIVFAQIPHSQAVANSRALAHSVDGSSEQFAWRRMWRMPSRAHGCVHMAADCGVATRRRKSLTAAHSNPRNLCAMAHKTVHSILGILGFTCCIRLFNDGRGGVAALWSHDALLGKFS